MKFKKFKFKKVKSTNDTAIRIIKKTKHNLGMVVAETHVNVEVSMEENGYHQKEIYLSLFLMN